jgi:hypothetical protein
MATTAISRVAKSDPVIGTPGAPAVIIDDFLPAKLATDMRQHIDAHFANPDAHRAETHQVWNYWFVPQLYTYLRANPEKIIGMGHIESFMRRMKSWSIGNLGMSKVTRPYLSLYVPGCRQGWHNDATNGRFAFVYSLTRDDRRTTGGETLIMHQGDPLRRNLTRPAAGSGLHQAIEPRFNRLVVFDDRMPHAVERVDGSMDPVEGRFVLHGHLSEAGTAAMGALPVEAVAAPIATVLREFGTEAKARAALYHGPVTFRLKIDQSGIVRSCEVLMDRVLHSDHTDVEWDPLRALLMERLRAVRFPSAEGETTVIQPVVFGGPLLKS